MPSWGRCATSYTLQTCGPTGQATLDSARSAGAEGPAAAQLYPVKAGQRRPFYALGGIGPAPTVRLHTYPERTSRQEDQAVMLVRLKGVVLEVAGDEGRLLWSHSPPDPPDEVTVPSA